MSVESYNSKFIGVHNACTSPDNMCSSALEVNNACNEGRASELIIGAEALQERQVAGIAGEIALKFKEQGVRLILVTGPSSGGKSTFCKRLTRQLVSCGIRPESFSTDDYFVNRVDSPRLPDGSYDFDNFETVEHKLLERDILSILDGNEVNIPEFNFVTGLREYNGKKIKLDSNSVLIVEGIHALNPMLAPEVAETTKYRIFIDTVTSIELGGGNPLPTSDNRLIRRIMRDYRNGSFSAVETISNWPNVKRSETKWIYPYKETADVIFNSTFPIELAVLHRSAERVLATVPADCSERGEAERLLHLIGFFASVPEDEVPEASLIRSFLISED